MTHALRGDLRELDAQILGLVARVQYLEASAGLTAAPQDLDPLFCLSKSSPAYPLAECGVYVQRDPDLRRPAP